jgi:hypothetical protein
MVTKLALICCILALLIFLLMVGIRPTDKPASALLFSPSLLVIGLCSAFRTEEVVSPPFRSFRFYTITFKALGWWLIVVGFVFLALAFVGTTGLLLF